MGILGLPGETLYEISDTERPFQDAVRPAGLALVFGWPGTAGVARVERFSVLHRYQATL